MSKFKVGDRVRVVREDAHRLGRPFVSAGAVGTIFEGKGRGGPLVDLDGGPFIDLDDGFEYTGAGWAYDESELELIND